VQTSYYPSPGKIKLDFPQYSYYEDEEDPESKTEAAQLEPVLTEVKP
jgi:hypothetical protein